MKADTFDTVCPDCFGLIAGFDDHDETAAARSARGFDAIEKWCGDRGRQIQSWHCGDQTAEYSRASCDVCDTSTPGARYAISFLYSQRCRACGAFMQVNPTTGRLRCPVRASTGHS